MLEKMNNILCDPFGITPEQKEINEREWRDPNNWKGWLFPVYSSALDTRPFVPGRMFRPKDSQDTRWVQILCSQVPNIGQRNGTAVFLFSIAVWILIVGAILINTLLGIT